MSNSQSSRTAGANGYQIPAGYTEQSSDIVGFWDGTGAIHFIPRFVRMFDSSIDRAKSSTLLIGTLVDPCKVIKAGDDKEEVLANKGMQIGIWTKPGMAALKNLGGQSVYMYEDGEKDTGKPNPMKLYKVMSKGQGQKLPVEGDFRKFSKPTEKVAPAVSTEVTDDNIPF
jgi:hypothetical protein